MKKIRDIGKGGLNADLADYDLPPHMVTRATNVRAYDGAITNSSAMTRHSDIADPVWIDGHLINGFPVLTLATQTGLFEWDSSAGNWDQVGGPYTPTEEWSSQNWGEHIIFNHEVDGPFSKGPSDSAFAQLPGWPAAHNANVVRKYRNFVLALNLDINGQRLPHSVMWSDEAPASELPDNWNYADPASLAGLNQFSPEYGEIIDGHQVGDVFVIFTTRTMWVMSLTSATLNGVPLVFDFRKVADRGLIHRGAVCNFGNQLLCVSDRTIYVTDGFQVQDIADDRVLQWFHRTRTSGRVRVAESPATKEVLIYFSGDGNDDRATQALVWNYEYNAFTVVDLPHVRCVAWAPFAQTATTWDAFAQVPWLDLTRSWASLGSEETGSTLYFVVDPDPVADEYRPPPVGFDNLPKEAFGDKGIVGDAFTTRTKPQNPGLMQLGGIPSSYPRGDWYPPQVAVGRTGIDLDQILGTSTQTVKRIMALLPQIKGEGRVRFRVGSSMDPDSSPTYDPWREFTIGQGHKVDVRRSGRYLAWELQLLEGYFQLSGFDVDVREVAGR